MFHEFEKSALGKLLATPAPSSPRVRTGVVLSTALLYALAFLILYPAIGNAALALSVLPVALAAGLFGLRGGVIAGLLIFPLNLILIAASRPGPWILDLQAPGSVAALAALLASIVIVLLTELAGRIQAMSVRSHMTAILEATTDMMATATPDGRILYINRAGRRILGLSPNELITGMRVDDFQSPEHRDGFLRSAISTALQTGLWSGETELINRSGKKIPVSQLVLAHRSGDGQVDFLSTIVRDISRLKQTEQAEREQRILAEALCDTASALNSTLKYEEVLNRILLNVERVVPHDMANILLIEDGAARVTRYRKLSIDQAIQGSLPVRIPIKEVPNLAKILKTGLPLVIADTHTDPNWVELSGTGWIRSAVIAPIQVQGDVIGFLSLDSTQPGFYTGESAGRLQTFADQAAIALQNARLLAEAERRAGEFSVLYEMAGDLATQTDLHSLLVTLVERATALLNTPGGEILLCEAGQNDLELALIQGLPLQPGWRIPMGEGLAGRVAATRQPLIVNDYRSWEHRALLPGVESVTASMGVPMLYRGELIGVLVVFEVGMQHAFSEADSRLLSMFAGQAASAVHNTRLFQETRRRLAEMEAINRVSNILRSTRTLQEMMPELLDATLNALDTQAGAIWLYDPRRRSLFQPAASGWFLQAEDGRQPGEAIAQHVFQNGLPLVAANLRDDTFTTGLGPYACPDGWSGACLPIRTNQTTVGVLFVALPLPLQLDQNKLHLLSTLADMAGNAIHRVSLHEQTQKHLQRLAALHTVDLTINTSLDLSLVFGILLDQALLQLGVDAARILVLEPITQSLDYLASRGFQTSGFTVSQRLGQGLGSQALLERKLVRLDLKDLISQADGREIAHDGLQSEIHKIKSEGFITYCGIPLIAKGQVKGILEFFQRSSFDPDAEWLDFAETLAGQAALAIENASLFTDLQRSNLELTLAYDATIEGWSHALDLRDKETEGHTRRVTEVTLRLARSMGVDDASLVHIRRGSLLHDIGKMGIPDSILLKPGPLRSEEQSLMRMHPVYAQELLSPIPFLRQALEIPYCHHEKWDGSGYPRGLKGEQIPLAARIFAVADVWDALCSNRPYRPAWPEEKARQYIRQQANRHFDPQVVEVFLEHF